MQGLAHFTFTHLGGVAGVVIACCGRRLLPGSLTLRTWHGSRDAKTHKCRASRAAPAAGGSFATMSGVRLRALPRCVYSSTFGVSTPAWPGRLSRPTRAAPSVFRTRNMFPGLMIVAMRVRLL